MSPRLHLVGLVVALLTAAEAVHGSELAVELEWRGPAACQDNGSVEREIQRIIGQTNPALGAQELSITASVTQLSHGRWSVSLRTQTGGQRGERTLVGASCSEVRRATALIVALMINPNVQLTTPETPAEPVTPSLPGPDSPSGKPDASREATQPRAVSAGELELLLGVGMLAGLGVLPGLDVGLGVFGALELDRLSLELSGMLWLPRRKVSDQALPAGGDFTLIGTNLLVCYQPFHALTLGACAGAGARNMRGEGFGVTDPESAQAWWAVAVAEGFAQFQLTRSLALRAAIGTEFPFRPPTFSLAGLGQVHSPGAAGVHASLAFYLRF